MAHDLLTFIGFITVLCLSLITIWFIIYLIVDYIKVTVIKAWIFKSSNVADLYSLDKAVDKRMSELRKTKRRPQ